MFLTLAYLLSMFRRLNLSSLPTSNPGNGNPWLHSSGSIVVGTFSGSSVTWSSITGVPSAFPPSAHTHLIGDITGLQAAFDAKLSLSGGAMTGSLNMNSWDITNAGNIYADTLHQGGAQVLTVDDVDLTVMAYDADLAAIGALPGASGLLRKTATNTWTLDTATYYTASQVDSLVQGLDPKASVRVATTANITLLGTQTIDGVAVVAGDRVLAKNQTTTSQNGIYVVAAGAWSRAADMDVWTEVPGAYVFVEQGTVNADTGWVCTSDQGGTIGTTAITFGQFAGAGSVTSGTGIIVNGNQVSIDSTVATLNGAQTLTNKTLTAPNIGAATGSVITLSAGTITVSTPNSIAQTWNSGATTFVGVDVNITDTASANGSKILDIRTGGTSRISVKKVASAANHTAPYRLDFADAVSLAYSPEWVALTLRNTLNNADANFRAFGIDGSRYVGAGDYLMTPAVEISHAGWRRAITLINSAVVAWSSTTGVGGTVDLSLTRASAGILQVGDGGTNANGGINLSLAKFTGYPTLLLPAAASNAGSITYDTTLAKLVGCNGSTWSALW